MQPSLQTVASSIPVPSGEVERSLQNDDLVYHAVTVAAILMVLGSLWVF